MALSQHGATQYMMNKFKYRLHIQMNHRKKKKSRDDALVLNQRGQLSAR